jgi:hypothetical protein
MAEQDPPPRPHPQPGLGYALSALALWAAVLVSALVSSQGPRPEAHRGASGHRPAEGVSCAHTARIDFDRVGAPNLAPSHVRF